MSLSYIERTPAEAAAERLRSLAHPVRLMILACLKQGERSVGDLERVLDLKQPGLSQQLAELRQAGWVATRRQSKSVIYRLAQPGVGLLLSALDELLSGETPTPERLLAALAEEVPASSRISLASPGASGGQAAVFAVTGSRVHP
ncbi:MAG TPA: metalloregulator ArsR/SmtB family transcription factor [Stellaceae bacterium]|jgi:DNA-binding transcriptional ArsR family regulator|nr:metalloregulator ArsR/SmtB family transcription factor [Stellaceae bacterium]